MRIDLTRIQIEAVVTHLRTMLGEEPDEQLLADSLEGETDAFELISRLLAGIEDDDGMKAALATQIQDRSDRKARAEKRIEARREAIGALLNCAGLDKLTLPEATLSLRRVPAKPIVIAADAIPDELCRFTKKPDMALIKDAVALGGMVDGVTMDNGNMVLSIRRKG